MDLYLAKFNNDLPQVGSSVIAAPFTRQPTAVPHRRLPALLARAVHVTLIRARSLATLWPGQQPEKSDPKYTVTTSRFQFGLLSLICLIAVAAAVLALIRPLHLPTWADFVFAAYAIAFAAYVVLRGVPRIRRGLRLRRRMGASREQLQCWIEEKRAGQATTKTDDQAL
jgi:hypothetical protein